MSHIAKNILNAIILVYVISQYGSIALNLLSQITAITVRSLLDNLKHIRGHIILR